MNLGELPAPQTDRHKDLTKRGQICFEHILIFEDYLNDSMVFVSGFDKTRKAALAAYMTIIQFEAFDKAMKEFNIDRFTGDQWRQVVSYYRFNRNLSPTLGLLSALIALKVGLPSPLDDSAEAEAFYSN